MDFANRGNRPSQSPQSQQSANNDEPSQTVQPAQKSNKGGLNLNNISALSMLFAGALLLLLIVLGLVFAGNPFGEPESDLIANDRYQAVFLDSSFSSSVRSSNFFKEKAKTCSK